MYTNTMYLSDTMLINLGSTTNNNAHHCSFLPSNAKISILHESLPTLYCINKYSPWKSSQYHFLQTILLHKFQHQVNYSGSVRWGCDVVASRLGMHPLEVSQCHCSCYCPHCRGLRFWCRAGLPCPLAAHMSTSGFWNAYCVDMWLLI